ncbi:hypothetical protein HMPREF9714_02478 [Myroides odoratimimus CCUG 12901]|nr:hypothetical protein HMPREF9714_02478 [Myroides odoratimimus CCUG 12901]
MLKETYKILFEKYLNYYFYNVHKNNEEKSRNSANSIIKNISSILFGYFGQTVPVISVKWCHFEKLYNNTKKVTSNFKSLSFSWNHR